MGTAFPRPPIPRYPPGGSTHPYFARMLYLAYIIVILLPHSKCATAKIGEIKSKNILSPDRRRTKFIPLNAARNGRKLSWQCSIFEPSIASSPRAPDRVSILGTRVSLARSTGSPLRFAIGGRTLRRRPSPCRCVLY